MATEPPGGSDPTATRRRGPRREALLTYTLRIEIVESKPLVWREVEVSSGMFLDELHEVIQAAVGWEDYHLHRFTLGSSAWDKNAEHYLCPSDEDEDADEGIPEQEVRLDEVLAEPGDEMTYTYDYGDNWEHVVRLEAVTQRPADAARSVCIDGRRVGPPEDCGGVWGYQELVTSGAIDAFAVFDPAAANQALAARAQLSLLAAGGGPAAILLRQLGTHPVAYSLAELVSAARLDRPVVIEAEDAAAMTRRFAWLLHRVGDRGIRLTAAGYLPPVHVEAAFSELRLPNHWGVSGRESQTFPVLWLRESAVRLGLLRKNRGLLQVTRVGIKVRDDPTAMLRHIVARVPVKEEDQSIEKQASVVTLIGVAAGTDVDRAAFRGLRNDVLTALDWRMSDGEPLHDWTGSRAAHATLQLIEDLAGFVSDPSRSKRDPTPLGIAFARSVLQRGA